ncbi:VanZ family protein [Beggiatoa leptomitoformis]|uniref:VanZ family protein n=1 Tax=Beggiatoa leptomitoformis TaxID=288004 RepID=A0A2N9YDR5_9GAMM|nr:VanZ family protein [Beggiatoa leptomitoformis]ALG68974.1 VanZ family protein [Beggiatoa leptomitoformis]AUI68633.1 VanZ family protein [Beggiatoa leptomitoformis]
MKRIAILYSLFIICLIIVADQGHYNYVLKQVHAIPYGDKVGHFILMGLLAFVINMGLNCAQFSWKNIKLLKGSVFVVTFVTLEEISQYFFPNRHFDMGDLFSDYLGIFLFGQLALWLSYRQKHNEKITP